MYHRIILSIFLISIFYAGKSTQQENGTNTSSFVFNRIVNEIDLRKIYPEFPKSEHFDIVLAKTRTDFKRKFNFVFEHDKLYFLTSVVNPGTIALKFTLNSTLNDGNETNKSINKEFTINPHESKKIHTLKLKFQNSLEEILKSEQLILDELRTKLWTNANCTECLSIFSIRPVGKYYEVTFGSSEIHNDVIDEICFSHKLPNSFLIKNNAGLKLDYSYSDCDSNKMVSTETQPEKHTIRALINVNAKNPLTKKGKPLLHQSAGNSTIAKNPISTITTNSTTIINSTNTSNTRCLGCASWGNY